MRLRKHSFAALPAAAMHVLYLICACGRDSKIAWPMDRPTLRAEILPRTRCSRCHKPAIDMRIIWEPPGVNAMDGARDSTKKRTD